MARGDVRIAVTLACEVCKRRNYQTNKSKRNNPDRISLRKVLQVVQGAHEPPGDPVALRTPRISWPETASAQKIASRSSTGRTSRGRSTTPPARSRRPRHRSSPERPASPPTPPTSPMTPSRSRTTSTPARSRTSASAGARAISRGSAAAPPRKGGSRLLQLLSRLRGRAQAGRLARPASGRPGHGGRPGLRRRRGGLPRPRSTSCAEDRRLHPLTPDFERTNVSLVRRKHLFRPREQGQAEP